MASCQNMGIFDIQGLILKYFSQKHALVRNSTLIFFTKSTIIIIGTIHISHVKKSLLSMNVP